MTKRSYEILRMKDKFQSLKIKVPTIFDLPSRLLIVGKSELSGKSNLIANLILREKCYRKYFNPENIIIVCQSSSLNDKWKTMITELDIPDMNIIKRFFFYFIFFLKLKAQLNERRQSLIAGNTAIPHNPTTP